MRGNPSYTPHYEEYYEEDPTLVERWTKGPIQYTAGALGTATGILHKLILTGAVLTGAYHSYAAGRDVIGELRKRRIIRDNLPRTPLQSLGPTEGPRVVEDIDERSLSRSPSEGPRGRSRGTPSPGPDSLLGPNYPNIPTAAPPIIDLEMQQMHRDVSRQMGFATAPPDAAPPRGQPGSIAQAMFEAEQEVRQARPPAARTPTSVPLVPVVEDVPTGIHNEFITVHIPGSKKKYPGYTPPTTAEKIESDRWATRGMALRSNHSLAEVVSTLAAEGAPGRYLSFFTPAGVADLLARHIYIPQLLLPMYKGHRNRIHAAPYSTATLHGRRL